MNMQRTLSDLGSIEALLDHMLCERVGQFNDTTYYQFDEHQEFIALNKNHKDYEFIDTRYELLENVKGQFEFIFKKQPVLANLCTEIFKCQLKIHSDRGALLFAEEPFRSLTTKLLNKDVMKHIKNSGYNIQYVTSQINDKHSQDDSIPVNFEELDDTIEAIILNQKAKKFVQKIYSEKYKDLVNDRTFNICKNFALKNISISTVNHDFGSKIARYESPNDANEGLTKLYKELTGWTKSYYVQKAKDMNVDIIETDDNSLCLKIRTYEQSEALGAGQWCLSYDKSYFKQYKGVNNSIFFNYDFSKDPDKKDSMVGMVVDSVGTLLDAYWRDDTSIFEDSHPEIAQAVDNFKLMLPKKYTIEEKNNNLIDSANLKETVNERTLFLLDYCHELESIDILNNELENNRLELNLSKNADIHRHLWDVYEDSKINENDAPETVVLRKKKRSFFKNYLNNSDSFSEKHPNLLDQICDVNDFDMMRIYITNVDAYSNIDRLLHRKDMMDSKEGREMFIEMVTLYKTTHQGSEPFSSEHLFRNLLFVKDETGYPDESFIEDIVKMNNGRVNINIAHRYLDPDFQQLYGTCLADHQHNVSLVFKTVLKHIDVDKLALKYRSEGYMESKSNPFFKKIQCKINQSLQKNNKKTI